MNIEKITGLVAVIAAGTFIMSMIGLMISFGYPKIIRKDSEIILRKLYEKRKIVPYLYYLFGVAGLLIIYFSVLMGECLGNSSEVPFSKLGMISGIIYGVLLFSGITRYTGLFPKLAKQYVEDNEDKKLCENIFESFNYHVGNTVTEHVAFVFLAAMILFFSIGYLHTTTIPTWFSVFGIITGFGVLIGNLEFLGVKKVFIINRIFSSISGIWLLIVGIFLMI